MTLTVTNLYLKTLAQRLSDHDEASPEISIGIYSNDVTPSASTVLGDLTVENTSSMSTPSGAPVLVSGWWTQDWPTYSWTVAGEKTIYGWLIRKTGGTPRLIYAERFSSPIVVAASTQKLVEVTIRTKARETP